MKGILPLAELAIHRRKIQVWKESLNSDGYQYQQNKLSPLILTELTEHTQEKSGGLLGSVIE
jgi:hypothetical protein